MNTPEQDRDTELRECLILMMVRHMGMTYDRALIIACGPCPPQLAVNYAREARRRFGEESQQRAARH